MKILVAKDEAFNFIYRANIDSLKSLGSVSFFSPLHDSRLPHCDLLYLPGGYPELYLREIASNPGMTTAIRQYAERDGRLYAECGGFMYLCHDIDGTPMCGVLPFRATMENAHLHLGYRQMTIGTGAQATIVRGHEFHYSDVDDSSCGNLAILGISKECRQLTAKGTAAATPIYRYKNLVAGYTHWYWAENGFPFFNLI